MSLEHGLFDLAVVSLLAALTPLVVGLLPQLRVAQVVILILGGIVVGPQVLGWADPGSIELFSNLGLGSFSCWRATNSTSGCSGSGPGGSRSCPGWSQRWSRSR